MATISFFAGYEIRDVEAAKKILKVLEEPGIRIELTEEERTFLEEQEKRGRELLKNIDSILEKL
jgi:hypothetical protein